MSTPVAFTWTTGISAFLGLALVSGLIPLILKWSPRLWHLERAADPHHGQVKPVPRFGGLALAITFAFIAGFVSVAWDQDQSTSPYRIVIVVSSLAMFALGFWDDLRPLGAKRKLAAQCAIALLVWTFGIGIQTFKLPFSGTIIQIHGWGALFTVVWLVGFTNLINLIDGVDGLAGGISLMLMILTAYVAQSTGDLALMAVGMSGALLGFLRFNFPPASIYLGDGGAYFLGFQIGLYSLVSAQKGTILAALAAPLFVLALPIADTALAILRRGLRGLPVFRPDRRHIHHRLLSMGLSRKQVVLSIYGLTAFFMLLGLICFWSEGKLVPILAGLVLMILLFCAGRLRFSREWFAVGHVIGNSLEMRQEIRYALGITRWLASDGSRCKSVDDLWEDLIFVARKLEFNCVKLKLEGAQREWKRPGAPVQEISRLVHPLPAPSGVLEFGALCQGDPATHRGNMFYAGADPKLFEIRAELLAEGWAKAVQSWTTQNGGQLIFPETEQEATVLPRGYTDNAIEAPRVSI